MRHVKWAAALLLGMNLHGMVKAEVIPGYPDDVISALDIREVALLPQYCKYTQWFRDRVAGGDNAAEVQRWYALIGDRFHSMHHYCFGLMYTNRALHLARSRQVKDSYLRRAIVEYDYVLRHASPEFPLLAEILTKKAENLLRLEEMTVGALELERAIELRPDYWPAYAALSDHYRNLGDLTKARRILEKGLSFSPDSQSLHRRLAALGSTPSRPNPALGTKK